MPFDAACMKYHACLIELIQTLKALTHCTQNCKDFFKKVGEKIVAHLKNVFYMSKDFFHSTGVKIVAVVKKSCSMYGR